MNDEDMLKSEDIVKELIKENKELKKEIKRLKMKQVEDLDDKEDMLV